MQARLHRPRVAFKALGCRVNYEEIECLRGRFADEGYELVPFEGQAEVYVINTCTVTALADADSRKIVRRAVRRKPVGGLVLVTGCYAQRDPEALRALAGVDLVLGNTEKSELFEHVRSFRQDRRLAGDIWVGELPLAPRLRVTGRPRTSQFLRHGSSGGGPSRDESISGGRTRATLKIQDGCNERCTYCIIPAVRGVSVSRDEQEILEEARHLAGLGFREIALTGVNTGCYGHDLGDPDGLARLIEYLEAQELCVRYRLNSLEPATVTRRVLDAIDRSPSFCRHFHVPLQHGSSRVLRRMGRAYDAAFYREVILEIHERFPDTGIGADVMVGFPGESDADFDACRDFIASLPLSYLHVFTYSERPGTPATRMPDHLHPRTRQDRSRTLHELEDRLRLAFIERLCGTEHEVLVEGKMGPNEHPTGLTGSYLRVEMFPAERVDEPGAAHDRPRENELWRVRIEGALSPRLARARLLRKSCDAPVAP